MYTFKKEERLCNKKLIDELYHNGSSFLCYPFKVSWLLTQSSPQPAQIIFSVAKKRYRRAADRNLIKRRMREAYRLHKQQFLYEQLTTRSQSILLSVSYIGTDIAGYGFIEKKMLKMFIQLCEKLGQ